MFVVRTPISIALGLLARKGAERVTSQALGRVHGVPGNETPDAKDLSVKLRWVLLAALIEAAAFSLTKTLADRGAARISTNLLGEGTKKKA
ncbi:MAG: DUF4235 domain-containing protein [Solirubrobacteraceae bacterium]|nr:DUF4235 domain-containing protein [Solirubrobacteraceae bacterium]